MDLRMPGMDGDEAVKRLRAREAELGRPRTVVIAITASILDLEVDSFRVIGFDDLMLKPFPESELLDMLHRHCGLELSRAVPAPSGLAEAELTPRIALLDTAWINVFDQLLVIGDRAEAQALLDLLPDRLLAESFSLQLKEYQFETLRNILAPWRAHA